MESLSGKLMNSHQTAIRTDTGGHPELLAAAAESFDHCALDQQRKRLRALFWADNQRPVGRVGEGFGAHHRVFSFTVFQSEISPKKKMQVRTLKNPASIKNKIKRQEVYARQKQLKNLIKRKVRVRQAKAETEDPALKEVRYCEYQNKNTLLTRVHIE